MKFSKKNNYINSKYISSEQFTKHEIFKGKYYFIFHENGKHLCLYLPVITKVATHRNKTKGHIS